MIGSSLGVLAAHAGGESSQTPQELMYLLVLSVVAAAVMAAISSWLAGDMLEEVRASTEEGSHRRASLQCLLLIIAVRITQRQTTRIAVRKYATSKDDSCSDSDEFYSMVVQCMINPYKTDHVL